MKGIDFSTVNFMIKLSKRIVNWYPRINSLLLSGYDFNMGGRKEKFKLQVKINAKVIQDGFLFSVDK